MLLMVWRFLLDLNTPVSAAVRGLMKDEDARLGVLLADASLLPFLEEHCHGSLVPTLLSPVVVSSDEKLMMWAMLRCFLMDLDILLSAALHGLTSGEDGRLGVLPAANASRPTEHGVINKLLGRTRA